MTKLNLVTITGADNSVLVSDLINIARRFWFVEWGILLADESKSKYPDCKWLSQLGDQLDGSIRFAAHLCGKFAKDFCHGNLSVLEWWPDVQYFQRIQLNISTYTSAVDVDLLIKSMSDPRFQETEFIIQLKSFNDPLANPEVWGDLKDRVVFFLDRSGGKGILPQEWPAVPEYLAGSYCGFAGGLNPQNIETQLPAIFAAAKELNNFWIDCESGVRAADKNFSIPFVLEYLFKCQQYICTEFNVLFTSEEHEKLVRLACEQGKPPRQILKQVLS